jgi:hypothetical protein
VICDRPQIYEYLFHEIRLNPSSCRNHTSTRFQLPPVRSTVRRMESQASSVGRAVSFSGQTNIEDGARDCSVCRYIRIGATGVFSSCVTALMTTRAARCAGFPYEDNCMDNMPR